MEGLGSCSTLLSNLVSIVPLILEVSSFGIPLVDFSRHGVEEHNSFHKWDRYSCSEEADEDIFIRDAGTGDVALEGCDITLK